MKKIKKKSNKMVVNNKEKIYKKMNKIYKIMEKITMNKLIMKMMMKKKKTYLTLRMSQDRKLGNTR